MSFSKLQANGITCKLLNWTKVSLTGRRQQVVINGFQSDESNVIGGIPQGLVLGLLLLLIYVTMVDLPRVISSPSLLCVGDTKVFLPITEWWSKMW